MHPRLLLSLLALILLWSSPRQSFAQAQTPFQLETGHNTAACSNDNTQPYCYIRTPAGSVAPAGTLTPVGFPVGPGPWAGGWVDNRQYILSPIINPGVGDYLNAQGYFGNVAKGRGAPPWPDLVNTGDVHNLLYPGNTTKIFAAIQHWFSNDPLQSPQSGPPQVVCDPAMPDGTCPASNFTQQTVDVALNYGQQKVTGYSVNDCAYIDAMTVDLWQRGFDGVIANVGTSAFGCATVPLSSGKYVGQPDNFTAQCPATSAFVATDLGLQKLQNAMLTLTRILGLPPSQFQFAMQIDQGDFQFPVTCGCMGSPCNQASDLYQAQCIRDKLRAELKYYAQGDPRSPAPCHPATPPVQPPGPGYFQSPNYLAPTPNSPVVQFFINENAFLIQCGEKPCILDANTNPVTTCSGQTACWTAIWSDVRQYASAQLGLTPYFVFKGQGTGASACLFQPDTPPTQPPVGAFNHVQSDGCYLWTQPNRYVGTANATPDQLKAAQVDWGQGAVDFHYLNWAPNTGVMGANGQPALYFGAAWKGVDDRFWNDGPNTWLTGLVTAQRCGQTWVETFAEPGTYFSPTNQLGYMIVPTYDDHQAGTQFQTGIDSCASVSASLVGSTLSWNTTFSDPVYGSVTTLDHYRLFNSPDDNNVTVLADNIPPDLSGSLDISGLPLPPGSHALYLKLVGKPGIFNKISESLTAHTLSLIRRGPGLVTASHPAMVCKTGCSKRMALYAHGTKIKLTARPLGGFPFLGWSGACRGTAPTCTVTLDKARTVTANFGN